VSGWALTLDGEATAALGPLRLRAGLETCAEGGVVWLRGAALDDGLRRELSRLPARRRYDVLPDGLLRPWGRRLPHDRLPAGPWEPLAERLAWALPPTRAPAPAPGPVGLRLERGAPGDGPLPEAGLLRLARADLLAWAARAPAVRLEGLTVALAGAEALVRGRPLPSLPGLRFALDAGVAVPLGFVPRPRLAPPDLALLLELMPGEVGLLRPEGGWERVSAGAFGPARRASLRAAAGPAVEEGPRG